MSETKLARALRLRPGKVDLSDYSTDATPAIGGGREEGERKLADLGADLLCVGTHGRTGRERMLMGSVAEQTLRSAPCSVLVVKLPKGLPGVAPPAVETVGAM